MKQHVFVAGLMVAALAGPALADDAADVKAMIERHYAAFQGEDIDMDTALSHHLEDFTFFPGGGGLLWDFDWREGAERMGVELADPASNVQMRNFNAQMYGDVAVVTFYLDGTKTVDGKERNVANRVSAVWVKTDDGWKEAHHHESVLMPRGHH